MTAGKPRTVSEAIADERGWKVLLLDLNGTLVDDEELTGRIYTEVFHRHGVPFTVAQYLDTCLGLTDEEIILRTIGDRASEVGLADRILAKKSDLYCQAPPKMMVDAQLVKRLRAQYLLGIVSSATTGEIEAVLSASGFPDEFSIVVSRESVVSAKPSPEPYLTALEWLSVSAREVLAFEDSLPGLASARAAGITSVGIASTLRETELMPYADFAYPTLSAALQDLTQ